MNTFGPNAAQSRLKIDPARSWLMSRVRGKNTTPELVVRRTAHSLGYRFRLHRRDLPGTPDLVFVRKRAVIFVHGCFWHRHKGCSKTTTPKSRVEFWKNKFNANVRRDLRTRTDLETAGWRVLTIWECETVYIKSLAKRISAFLGSRRS